MKCENCILMLDAYIEQELPEIEYAKVAAHLTDCAGCTDFCHELEKEQEIYWEYFAAVGAKPDLWSGVRSEIERAQPVKRQKIRDLLAGMIYPKSFGLPALVSPALILLGSIVFAIFIYTYSPTENLVTDHTVLQDQNPAPAQSFPDEQGAKKTPESIKDATDKKDDYQKAPPRAVNHVATRSVSPGQKTPFGRSGKLKPPPRVTVIDEVAAAEREYMRAIAVLTRDIARKKTNPEQQAQFKQLLEPLDRAISKTRRALTARPGNPVVIQYMTTAFSRKIEFLRTIAEN